MSETCDGIDNDCDGSIDETFTELGETCSTGAGACASAGEYVCSDDGLSASCDAVAGTPAASETCSNGIDDNCDGLIDSEDSICAPTGDDDDDDASGDDDNGNPSDNATNGGGGCQLSQQQTDIATIWPLALSLIYLVALRRTKRKSL